MLPIGSIVYLKEGTRKLMILNRGPIIENDGEKQMFDYSGCFYPVGLVPENVFYFNEENLRLYLKGTRTPKRSVFKSYTRIGRRKIKMI